MPIYEYICIKCGYKEDKLHKMSEKLTDYCKNCNILLVKKISPSNFKLKGTGWYKTDFKKNKNELNENK